MSENRDPVPETRVEEPKAAARVCHVASPADLSRLFATPWHRCYAASKLRTDPVYEAAWRVLAGTALPLLDVGCGLGLFAFFLRARGFAAPITGIDYDGAKVREAARIGSRHFRDLHFREGDARQGLPGFFGSVTILDILQFFDESERGRLLRRVADSVAPGGVLLIRSGVRDGSWRFRVTHWGDVLARATFWMKAMPTHYPTIEEIRGILEDEGLEGDVVPLWGRTPFNNYLFSYRRPPS